MAEKTLALPHPEERIEEFLSYLEHFPTGTHNRRAAEAVERLLYMVGDARTRQSLRNRLRSLRDPHMPPVEPDSWDGD